MRRTMMRTTALMVTPRNINEDNDCLDENAYDINHKNVSNNAEYITTVANNNDDNTTEENNGFDENTKEESNTEDNNNDDNNTGATTALMRAPMMITTRMRTKALVIAK